MGPCHGFEALSRQPLCPSPQTRYIARMRYLDLDALADCHRGSSTCPITKKSTRAWNAPNTRLHPDLETDIQFAERGWLIKLNPCRASSASAAARRAAERCSLPVTGPARSDGV